jgi:alcohol dehydrogenase class IV
MNADDASAAAMDFVYDMRPARVVFGSGTSRALPAELERLGVERALVLTTPSRRTRSQEIAELIGDRYAGIFPGAVMHTPVDVTRRAMQVVSELSIDGLVSIGGGSAIGLGKAIALRTDLPQIAVPTTYSGSEMTSILGETEDGSKATRSSPKILPEVVIYDVDLTRSLPVQASGTSGLNAIAHGVEALYAKDRNPAVSMMALEGISALASALPRIVSRGDDADARASALYGAWLCGTCLGAVGMSLHHKLCHVLGGLFDLPHAETHAIVLPHALAYNAPAIPDTLAKLGTVLQAADPASALYDLAGRLGARLALEDLGMPEDGIALAADRVLANPYWNPRPLELDAIRALLARAWQGERPAS